jgi:murein DD-endopeptidase
MNDWHPVYQKGVSTIAKLTAKLAALLKPKPAKTLYHPVQHIPFRITQHYGIRSTRYKLTGRHIGTDYAIPVGTSIHAPYDGTVTLADTGDATGHYCLFRYSFQGETYEERWCHLSKLPMLGSYKRGAVVAVSGNTGTSTGPHLHREVWKGKVDLSTINSKNWSQVTLDPEALTYSK